MDFVVDLVWEGQGGKHIMESQFWQIRVPFQSPFLMYFKTSLKYEYLNDIKKKIPFSSIHTKGLSNCFEFTYKGTLKLFPIIYANLGNKGQIMMLLDI
jgi:hypothetical protein